MLACRRQLIDDITARKQQLEHLQSERPRAMVVEMIENLTNQNKEMEPFAWPFRLVWAVLGERFFAGNNV